MSKDIILTRSQKLNNQIEQLKETLKTLQKDKINIEQDISNLKVIKKNLLSISYTKRLPLKTTFIEDKWLDDFYMQEYFNSLQDDISKFRNDVLLIGPSVTQHLKFSESYDILSTLTSLSFSLINFAFFCVNDCIESKDNYFGNFERGSHWSLLGYSRTKKSFYHYDSVKGLNRKHAYQLAQNINPDFKFIEVKVIQQSNTYECGLHVLVNLKNELNTLRNMHSTLIFDEYNLNSREKDCIPHGSSISDLKYEETSFKTHCVKRKSKQNISPSNLNIYSSNKFSILSNDMFSENSLLNVTDPEDILSQTAQDDQNILNTNQTTKTEHSSLKRDVSKRKNNSKKSKKKIENLQCIKLRPNENCINESKPSVSNNPNKTVNVLEIEPDITHLEHTCQRKPCLNILTDSHGRLINRLLSKDLENRYRITSTIKPNCKLLQILNDVEFEGKHLNKEDYLIIMGGTNDVCDINYDSDLLINKMKATLRSCTHTNIIIPATPYRYDNPNLNHHIRKLNYKVKNLCVEYDHVKFLSMHSFSYKDYTTHGLHLNVFGKLKLTNLIQHSLKYIEDLNEENMITVRITQRYNFLDKHSKKIKRNM